MSYIGNQPTTGHFPVDNFTSSGGSTYTLTRAPASAGAIEVSVQGILQPTTAYTVSGTTLTMPGVTTGVKIFVRHLGETLSLPTPADGSVTATKLGVNAITEDKLYISNAGSNGEFLSKQSGAVGGLTWAEAASGDLRNFIIDGDMTQWPEGTSITGAENAQYGPAMWYFNDTSSTVWTLSQSTDVPTYAQSGHQSKYSWKSLVTTADVSLGTNDYGIFIYTVTGSDWAALHGGKNVTMSFWAKFDAHASSSTSAPYSFSVSIKNSALNRSYVKELSMTADNTWQKFEFTFPTDTTGTWLFTEADKGAEISISMGHGSGRSGTNVTWEGQRSYGTTNQENLMDQANNAFYLSQVGLYIGASAPTTFLGESVATVKDQVGYYVEKIGSGTSSVTVGAGGTKSTTSSRTYTPYQMKRVVPTITVSNVTHFFMNLAAGVPATSAVASGGASVNGTLINCTIASTTAGQGCVMSSNGTDNQGYFIIDARH